MLEPQEEEEERKQIDPTQGKEEEEEHGENPRGHRQKRSALVGLGQSVKYYSVYCVEFSPGIRIRIRII